jgi:hypothetical protein
MQLHAACAALLACCCCWRWRFLLLASPGLKGMVPRGYRAALMAACAVTAAKAAQCFAAKNGARHMEAEPRAPSKSKQQRRAARLCMYLYTHSTTLLSRSLSFVACSYPAPSRFPSKRGAALPSLLAPFFESLPLQTNKQQEELSLQKRPLISIGLFLFASLANEQTISRVQPFKAPVPFRCLVLIRSALSLPPRTTG